MDLAKQKKTFEELDNRIKLLDDYEKELEEVAKNTDHIRVINEVRDLCPRICISDFFLYSLLALDKVDKDKNISTYM